MNQSILTQWLKSHSIREIKEQSIKSVWPEDTGSFTIAPLVHNDILCVSGKDAIRFLHGQTTCDIQKTMDNEVVLGACCNPKGRMIANFWLFRKNESLFYLVMPKGQAEKLMKSLGKYTPFYSVSLLLETRWMRLGVFVDNPCHQLLKKELTADCFSFPIDSNRLEFWIPQSGGMKILNALPENIRIIPTSMWQWFDVQQGLAWVTPSLSEVLLPQECNWDLVGGVSFKKGCYTGQEIVARLHFRGKAKSRVQYFIANTEQHCLSGTKLKDSDNKPCGIVINSVLNPLTKCMHLLASVRIDKVEKGIFTNENISLLQQSLPYSL